MNASGPLFHDPPLAAGDPVRHYMSGWTGVVKAVLPDDHGMAVSQGKLVEVEQVQAGGRLWKNITVTEAELERQ